MMRQPAGDDDTTSQTTSGEATSTTDEPRPKPAVSLRWLVLVAILNAALATGLLVIRPPWRVERAATAPELPAQVARLQAQIQRGEHSTPFSLDLTDDDLTATAAYFLARRTDVPFSQVRLAVLDGQVEASAVTTGLAVAVPVRVTANVLARDGQLAIQVMDVDVGGTTLPGFARDEVLRQANQAVDLSRYNLPLIVETVRLRPGQLQALGRVK